MRNRVHGLIRAPRPFILELIVLSDVRLSPIRSFDMPGKINAWVLLIHPFGGEATYLYLGPHESKN